MVEVMYDLADLFGFNFEAATFPELFRFLFMGICATAILASVIKVLMWLSFGGRRILK